MRKKLVMILSGWLILLCTQIGLAQDKVDAPVWNIGDKWVFTSGITIEVIKADENGYVVRYPGETRIFERKTLNTIYMLRGEKQERYREAERRLLNFPLTIGKTWKDRYLATLKWEDGFSGRLTGGGGETLIFENYKALGWEEVEVEAGKFRAVKLEYKREWDAPETGMREGKVWYWYSPEAKCLVKAQYEKNQIWGKFSDWELTSFQLAR